jgi:hypothetical protein
MSKSILKSKTFWFNVLGVGLTVASGGIIPSNVATPVIAVGNVVLRLVTKEPVHVIS